MKAKHKGVGFVRQLAVWILILIFTTQPVLAATEVVVDPSNGKNPGVIQAPNGTTVVQILTPNASGLSHNQYLNLQVGPNGIIYNNGVGLVNTQLAGWITGNPNLRGGSAQIILNEVTGKLPTNLNGFQEIAGNRATLILANPNGIVGNGFGFINVNRAVITTGTPFFGGSGSLEAFRVTGGQIAIEGSGLDASTTDRADIIARSVKLNAQINANELNIITGANQVNASNNQVAAISANPSEAKPAVALDVAALGGMYAGKITLVGTETGVGVNSQGTIQASGDIRLNQAGQITLAQNDAKTAKLSAGGSIDLTAVELDNRSSLYANKNITATGGAINNNALFGAAGDIRINAASLTNQGTIQAGLLPDGNSSGKNNLAVTTQGLLQNKAGGQLAAANIELSGATIDNAAAITAKDSVNLSATTITNSAAISAGTSDQTGAVSGGQINLSGDVIQNQGGNILAGDQLTVKATTLLQNQTTNDAAKTGGLLQAKEINLNDAADIANQGVIRRLSSQDWNLKLRGHLDNSGGSIETNSKNLTLEAATITNRQGSIRQTGNGDISLTTQGAFDNRQGLLQSGGALNISAASVDNRGAAAESPDKPRGLLAATDLTITTNSLENQGGQLQAGNNLTVNASQGISQNAEPVDSGKGGMQAGANLRIDSSQGAVTLTGTTRSLSSAEQAVKITAQSGLTNLGTLRSETDLDLTKVGGNIVNQGKISSAKSITVSADSLSTGVNSSLQAGVDDKGEGNGQGPLTITTNSIDNQGKLNGNSVTVQTKTLNNRGNLFASTLTVNADTVVNQGDKAAIASTGDMNLYVKDSLTNQDNATIYSMGNLVIAGSDKKDADTGEPLKSGSILNSSALIQAEKNVNLHAETITNKKSRFETALTEIESKKTSKSEEVYTGVPGGFTADDVRYGRIWRLSGGYWAYERTDGHDNGSTTILIQESSLLPVIEYITVLGMTFRSPVRTTYVKKLTAENTVVKETTVIADSPDAKILAGNNMLLRANLFRNEMGRVLANKELDATKVKSFENTSFAKNRIVEVKKDIQYTKHLYGSWQSGGGSEDPAIYSKDEYATEKITENNVSKTDLPGFVGVVGGGEKVTITSDTFKNETIKPSGGPVGNAASTSSTDIIKPATSTANAETKPIVLPSGGLYSINHQPTSRYLVETDSKFTKLQNFVSSDYLLNKLNINMEGINKRVGDGFYEQKLIYDQLAELTGRRQLANPYYTEEKDAPARKKDDITALMDNAAALQQSLNLRVGIALTPQQIAELKTDIVWLVKQNIGGEEVLVPQVYLAADTKKLNLSDSGALIIGDEVTITAANGVSNSGSIRGDKKLSITAASISNRGGQIQGDELTLTAKKEDIVNQSGVIRGNNVTLTAEKGNIKNETLTEELRFASGDVYNSRNWWGGDSQTRQTNTLIHQQGLIQADSTLNLTAQKDIAIKGAALKASNKLTLTAKEGDIKVDTVESKNRIALTVGNRWNSATLTAETVRNLSSSLQSGGDLTLNANHATLRGADVNAEGNIDMKNIRGNLTLSQASDSTLMDVSSSRFYSGNVNHLARDLQAESGVRFSELNQQKQRYGNQFGYSYQRNSAVGSELVAQGKVELAAGNALAVQGSSVTSKKSDVSLSGQSVNIEAVKDTVKDRYSISGGSNYYRSQSSDESVRGSSITAGNDVKITATGGSATITSSDITAGTLIQEAKIQEVIDKKKEADAKKDNPSGETKTDATTTETKAKEPVKTSEGNIATGKLTIVAAKDISIQATKETHEQLTESRKESSGLLSTTVTEKRDYSRSDINRSSLLSGESVTLGAGVKVDDKGALTPVVKGDSNLNVTASNVVATNDVNVAASGNISVEAGKNQQQEDHYSHIETSGLFSSGGFGITLGRRSEKLTTEQQGVSLTESNIGSTEGKVNMTSGNDTTVSASRVDAKSGVDINAGNDIKIVADNVTNRYKETYEFKQSGLTVAVGGGFVSTIEATQNSIQAAKSANDSRLKTLEAWQAYQNLNKLNNAVQDWSKTRDDASQLNLSITLGSQRLERQSESKTSLSESSVIHSSADVNLTANQNMEVTGSRIEGNNVKLEATNGNVNLLAGVNTSTQTDKTSSSSASIGVSIGLNPKPGASNVTPIASFSQGQTDANGNIITHTDTQVTATNNLTITSGAETTLAGAKASGDKVTVTAANLNLVSLQDSDAYHEKGSSVNLNLSLDKEKDEKGNLKNKLNAVGSLNNSHMDSDYASVTSQTGIYAGKEGFTVTVTNNTNLAGAVIDSNATPDKNKLTTGTLTWSDIHNKAAYSAGGSGIAYDSHTYQKTDAQNYKNQGLTPVLSPTVSGKADSTTTSAIALGTIDIKDKVNQKQDLSTLSRDSKQSINALGKIFDKQTVQEQQQLIKVFGEVAYGAIGKMNLKEGSPEKAAVDMVVGGIMSQLGGGGFGQGAAAAGLSQLAMTYIMKINDPATQQWVAALIGAVASDLTGGSGNVGNFIALSQIRNNFLSDWQEQQRQAAIASGDQGKIDWWNAIDDAQSALATATGFTSEEIKASDPLMQGIAARAQQIVASVKNGPGDYNGFSISPSGQILIAIGVGTAITWTALNVDWRTWSLGSSVLANGVDPNKLNHIFGKAEHNLGSFLIKYGGNQVSAYNALQNAAQEQIIARGITGVFEETVIVGGEIITVRGNVVNGIVKIGTAFIP